MTAGDGTEYYRVKDKYEYIASIELQLEYVVAPDLS